MLTITLSVPADVASLRETWLSLQARAAGSFFQSWNWVGCLAAERFPAPILLVGRDNGQLKALALFNRRRDRWGTDALWLGEAGEHSLDSIFVEHNGPLIAADADPQLLAACLHAALVAPIEAKGGQGPRRLVLSGVADTQLQIMRQAPGMVLRPVMTRAAPYVAIAALGPGEHAYLESLSANARYQIRRSAKRYGESGRILVKRAETVNEGYQFLQALSALHQAAWNARGMPGAFSHPGMVRFHRALISQALPAGEIDLLRIAAGERVIGYLYNFRYRGRVLAYQSGFDYASAAAHEKPGLTCHTAAIEMYRGLRLDAYDFLAGEDRYKTSLANAAQTMHWIDALPRWSVCGVRERLNAVLRRSMGR